MWILNRMLRYRGSIRTYTRSEGDQSSLRSGSASQPAILFAPPVVRIDDTSVAVEVLGVRTRVGHRTCTRAYLHVGHTRSLRGR